MEINMYFSDSKNVVHDSWKPTLEGEEEDYSAYVEEFDVNDLICFDSDSSSEGIEEYASNEHGIGSVDNLILKLNEPEDEPVGIGCAENFILNDAAVIRSVENLILCKPGDLASNINKERVGRVCSFEYAAANSSSVVGSITIDEEGDHCEDGPNTTTNEGRSVEEFDVNDLICFDPDSSSESIEEYAASNEHGIGSVDNLILNEPEDEPVGIGCAENFILNDAALIRSVENLILCKPGDLAANINKDAQSISGLRRDIIEYATASNSYVVDSIVNNEAGDQCEDGTNASINEASEQALDAVGVVYEGRPKTGRKRKIPNQSRVDRKRFCNTNQRDINTKGNVVDPKVFDENFECKCKLNCTRVVPVRVRRQLFSQYWNMGTFDGRVAYLMNCVTPSAKEVENFLYNDEISGESDEYFGNDDKKRNGPRTYSIYGKIVCQKAILKTLQINASRVSKAVEKFLSSSTLNDLRGKFSGGWNALPLAKTIEVRAHIESFPKYVSHYTREKTESMYLSSDLSLAKIYQLYKEDANDPVSQSFYNRIFYKCYNLRFKKPKKDTCHKCDLYLVKKKDSTEHEELLMLEEWYEAHLKSGECLQAQMKADFAAAKIDDELEALSFDFQKSLVAPRISTSIAYYLRQLNIYNFGIHIGSTSKGKFNVWPENVASKGTQEVGSVLKMHIEKIIKPIKKLILWSDSCGGQNRSIKLVLMMMHLLQNHKTLQTISMRYLLSGHSFMPNDTEFGEAETAFKRHNSIYTIDNYMDLMKECRTKNKFEVNRITSEDFFSVSNLEALITNRKVDLNNMKVSWLDTHEIVIEKGQPSVIKMSKNVGGPYQIVNLAKIGCELDFRDVVLGSLWPTGRRLSKEKVKDLISMIDLVPQVDQQFFINIINRVQVADFVDDTDGFGESVDFDVEHVEDLQMKKHTR